MKEETEKRRNYIIKLNETQNCIREMRRERNTEKKDEGKEILDEKEESERKKSRKGNEIQWGS